MVWEGFPCANPLCLPTPFRNLGANFASALIREEKGTQTQTFWSGHLWVGWGSWGPKSSVCPSKPRETTLFWRDIPGFSPGYLGGARKV